MEVCAICKAVIEGTGSRLTSKGCDTIKNASGGNIVPNPGEVVHETCRKTLVSKNHIDSRTRMESHQDANNNEFTFETYCFYCGKMVIFNGRKDKNVVSLSVSEEFIQSLTKMIEKRSDDEWTQTVSRRTSLISIGMNILHHKNCAINFRTNKSLPKGKVMATPTFEYRKGFLEVATLIRTKKQLIYSIYELIDEMNRYSGGNAYSFNQMKSNLSQHFGDEMIFSTHKNKKMLVTLQSSCEEVLNDYFEDSRKETASLRSVRKTSEIILNEIKSVAPNKALYPSSEEISLCSAQIFLPEHLNLLLSGIITGHNAALKVVSIGQAIIQSAHRENVMSPLQLALAVQMHYFTGSKFVVNTLNAFGFCSTYAEAKKFELCSAIELYGKGENATNNIPVIKYVADNVDHNLRTLDGKNTFHGMGIISIHPPLNTTTSKIPRINANLRDVKDLASVKIIPYTQEITPCASLMYMKLDKSEIQDPNSDLDLLWKISWAENGVRPGWLGMMQLVQQGQHSGKATVNFLPMIDMDPTDLTCINSTLHFICKDAEKYNAQVTVTFDNPLYWKARTIIENASCSSPLKRIVLCLGGFHLKMSYLGTIGHIMAGTGLDQVLAQVYAENTVVHMLSGKAYARSVRGLLMVDSALNSLLLDDIMDTELSSKVDDLLNDTLNGKQNVDELRENGLLKQIRHSLDVKKQSLRVDSTSRLWLQFMEMMDILRSNVRAERTGNYRLLKETICRKIPFFAASGHNAYTRAAYVFLQDMDKLETSNRIVSDFFNDGNFVTRRTDRFWAGLPDDLVIEQLLMRSLKISGGLTRGRGMDDTKRSLWLYSLPARAELNNAIQDFTNLRTETSEQHKECGKTRIVRDNKDINCIYNFLKERNPFSCSTPNEFRNIADGIVSTSKTNVDKAEAIGMEIVKSMEGKNVFEHSFERCKQVIRLSSKNEVVIDGEMVVIDPDTLFQRLLLLILQSDRSEEEREASFCYELCQGVPSLFDQNRLMREANSSALLKLLLSKTGNTLHNGFIEEMSNVVYVLEGDWLINKIPWQSNDTFLTICDRYVAYIKAKFGKAHIVFDFANSPTTKDEAWLRETKGALGIEVMFELESDLKMKKELFLRNRNNKRRFIGFLTNKLEADGFLVSTSYDNEIVKIAKVAVDTSAIQKTVVVGRQADAVIVLCFYASKRNFPVYYMYEESAKKPLQVFPITELKEKLGEEKSKHLLFVHAMGGSGTTSQMFNISKASLFTKLDDDDFANTAEIFCCRESPRESIIKAGNDVIVSLYHGRTCDTLNQLRYRRFSEKLKRGVSTVTCKALPPTEGAAKFHCLRVFHTVQRWMGCKLNPLNFGWAEKNCILRAFTTQMPTAPAYILSNIRCGCKGDCSSNRCTCFKVGFKCSSACKVCAGSSCSNQALIEEDSDHSDIDEDF